MKRLPCGGTPYKAVAVVLTDAYRDADDQTGMADRYFDLQTVINLAVDLGGLFAENNPSFDERGFLKACGLNANDYA